MSQKLDSCSKQSSLLFLLISKFNMCSMQHYESLCYFLKQLGFNHHFTKQQSNRMFCIPQQCLWKWARHQRQTLRTSFSVWLRTTAAVKWNTEQGSPCQQGGEWNSGKINNSQCPDFPLSICQTDKSLHGVRRKSGLPRPCIAATENSIQMDFWA